MFDEPKVHEIYFDFDSHEFTTYLDVEPSVRTGMLKGASQAMLQVAELQSKQSDFRPKVFDKNTNKLILIDTGAAISVTPNRNPNAVPDYSKKLHAVNGTRIIVYKE